MSILMIDIMKPITIRKMSILLNFYTHIHICTHTLYIYICSISSKLCKVLVVKIAHGDFTLKQAIRWII